MELLIVQRQGNGNLSEEFYNQLMDRDKITDDWLLISSPMVVVAILMLYLAAVKVGRHWMEERQPYHLTLVMRIYNVFQVFFNFYIIFAFIENPTGLSVVVTKSCSVDIGGDEMADLRYAYLYYAWGFLLSKIFDLLDTIFMVLRKKNSHITFLHVYHHTAMVFFTWVTLRYTKAHQAAIPGGINVLVHTIMYTYYFLATFGPEMQKYLWWKQHLTKLQLTQFAFIMVYILALYYNDCPISKTFTFIWLFNVFVFLCLFINFYVKAYILQPSGEEEKQKSS